MNPGEIESHSDKPVRPSPRDHNRTEAFGFEDDEREERDEDEVKRFSEGGASSSKEGENVTVLSHRRGEDGNKKVESMEEKSMRMASEEVRRGAECL